MRFKNRKEALKKLDLFINLRQSGFQRHAVGQQVRHWVQEVDDVEQMFGQTLSIAKLSNETFEVKSVAFLS